MKTDVSLDDVCIHINDCVYKVADDRSEATSMQHQSLHNLHKSVGQLNSAGFFLASAASLSQG